jgi:hypothetical protein
MLIRVNFRFPNYSELRYVEEVPTLGASIRSNGMTWFVARVEQDEAGSYSILLLGTKARGSERAA